MPAPRLSVPTSSPDPMLRQVLSIVLVRHLAEGGELFDSMMFTGSFSEIVSRTVCRQLLSALQVGMKCAVLGPAPSSRG
jgi:hypothetical protein